MSEIVPTHVATFASAWNLAVYNPLNSTWDVGDLGNSSAKVVYVSAYPHAPYIIGEHNATSALTGIFLSSLDASCRALHYRCRIFHAHYISTANDSRNGVFGDLYYQRADIALAALTMNPSRTQTADMIPSPFYRQYQVIVHERHAFIQRSTSIFASLSRLFDPLVWLLMGVMFVVVLLLLILMGIASGRLFGPRRRWRRDVQMWSFKMLEAVLGFGGVEMPHWYRWLMAHSFVTMIWMLWTVIIIGIISSQLLSILAAGRIRRLPFNSLIQLLESNFTVYGTGNMKLTFSLSQRLIPIQVDPAAYIAFVVDVLTRQQAAVIISQDDHVDLAQHSCHILIALDGITPHPISAFIFPFGSPLKAVFEQKYDILRETGIPQQDERFFSQLYRTPGIQRCLPTALPTQTTAAFRPLGWEDVRPIAGATLFTVCFNLLIFAAEVIHYKLCYWRRHP
ncbi:glutamate receptor ionotropic, delta-2-like isoform X2 [Paramacrobiotus metropolitanus]|uniref:glutamate receptor ionotropic, delta-2-like isoform X2 n=1 Tax=Paramacrobiotus metropolitanus TaxID=2943436 RepID=UPI002445A0A6|nr:glutamate receptor ionotropic, delta-2-like isoform X2 [Paramacrobiotus metropolitanus]